MAVNLQETETKYDAPADAALLGLEQLPEVAAVRGPDEERLEAEYYDTDDLRLIRAGPRWNCASARSGRASMGTSRR